MDFDSFNDKLIGEIDKVDDFVLEIGEILFLKLWEIVDDCFFGVVYEVDYVYKCLVFECVLEIIFFYYMVEEI